MKNLGIATLIFAAALNAQSAFAEKIACSSANRQLYYTLDIYGSRKHQGNQRQIGYWSLVLGDKTIVRNEPILMYDPQPSNGVSISFTQETDLLKDDNGSILVDDYAALAEVIYSPPASGKMKKPLEVLLYQGYVICQRVQPDHGP